MLETMQAFLAHAVQLEADAAEGYAVLEKHMRELGNAEAAVLFGRLGEFSRLHLTETQHRYRLEVGAFAPMQPSDFHWPDYHSPENPLTAEADAYIDTRQAIELALGMERQACDFYSSVANQTRNAAVQELAQVFAEEEAEHVAHLERWRARLEPPDS